MMTPRENFLETMRGGKPERFVRQFEFMTIPFSDPFTALTKYPEGPGAESVVSNWGIVWGWPASAPAPFPMHDKEHVVLADVCDWREKVQAPPLDYPEELWQTAETEYAAIDRRETLATLPVYTGLFEMTHGLMGMEDALTSFYTDPEEVHELIDYITDWYIAYLEQAITRLKPDCLFLYDDWGSSQSTFLSADMFREFYLEPYKRLLGACRDKGCEIVVLHCDCYAATYVPFMIEMGINVWQGGTVLNDIPSLVKEYGGQLTFLTGVDSSEVDKSDWTQEKIDAAVLDICKRCGKLYFCPCQTTGDVVSLYPGVYEAISTAVDKASAELF